MDATAESGGAARAGEVRTLVNALISRMNANQNLTAENAKSAERKIRAETDLESWSRAMQGVEGQRLMDLEERRKRDIEEQLVAYVRGEKQGIWCRNEEVAKRVPQRIAALEALRADIVMARNRRVQS